VAGKRALSFSGSIAATTLPLAVLPVSMALAAAAAAAAEA